jgi:hypothetical protein
MSSPRTAGIIGTPSGVMVVAGIGFSLTALIMSALAALKRPHLPGQFPTRGIGLFWSFLTIRI